MSMLSYGRRRYSRPGRPYKDGTNSRTPKVHLQGYIADPDGSISLWINEYSKAHRCESDSEVLSSMVSELRMFYQERFNQQ